MKDDLGNLNPFRYRSYVYDEETGLYYLNSRYYITIWNCWLNADSSVWPIERGVFVHNLRKYCIGNPVMYTDIDGTFPVLIALAIAGGTALAALIGCNHIENANNKDQIRGELQESYTQDEAKEEINKILSAYSSAAYVNFGNSTVAIYNSSYVDDKYDRQKICLILERTDGWTERTSGNMSAEWVAHNVFADYLGWIPPIGEAADPANIDRKQDFTHIDTYLTIPFAVLGLE